MVGFVENENFNVLSSLVVRFGEVAWQLKAESKRFGDDCYSGQEYIKIVREDYERHKYYIDFLKCRKWRNIYCEKFTIIFMLMQPSLQIN